MDITIDEFKQLSLFSKPTPSELENPWNLIYYHIGRDKKIEAIKAHRTFFSYELKESKVIIEDIMDALEAKFPKQGNDEQ